MLKRTLAAFAAFLFVGAATLPNAASAGNPWADYDWSGQAANPGYRAPSYYQGTARPQVNLGAASTVYGAEAAQTEASFARTIGHTQRYEPTPMPHEGASSPIAEPPAPLNDYAACNTPSSPCYTTAPVYTATPVFEPACDVACAPQRTYTACAYAEALFMNLSGDYDHSRPIINGTYGSLGSLGNTFGYEDVGDFDATGWRIGGDVLFGNVCDTWLKGVGFAYTDYGSFGGSRVGEFNGGLDFLGDAGHPRPSDHSGITYDTLGNDTHFRTMRQAAAEQNAIDGTDDCYAASDEAAGLARAATFRVDNTLDINAIGVNFVLAQRCRKVQFGVGWQQLNVDNNSFAGITGCFRDGNGGNADWYAPGVGGLSSQALTNAGLTHTGGADDGIANGAWFEMLSGAQTSNTLNGINFNMQARLFCYRGFDLVGGANAGIYCNQAEARVYERYSELEDYGVSEYGRQYDLEEDVVAFAGGLNLTGGYWVNDCVRIYGGYELQWISGLALAPTQQTGLTLEDYHFKHDGDLLLHGAKVGVEFCY